MLLYCLINGGSRIGMEGWISDRLFVSLHEDITLKSK